MSTETKEAASGINGVSFEKEGRRVYCIGNTYAIKDAIKAAGGHWDADRKAWWIGSGKQEELIASVNKAKPSQTQYATGLNVLVKGKAEYGGRTYPYSFCGPTRNGEAVKLHFRDGSKDFWAPRNEVTIVKTYREPMTLRRLNEMASEFKKGSTVQRGSLAQTKRCWECGRSFTFHDAKSNGGDWHDSYCGC